MFWVKKIHGAWSECIKVSLPYSLPFYSINIYRYKIVIAAVDRADVDSFVSERRDADWTDPLWYKWMYH